MYFPTPLKHNIYINAVNARSDIDATMFFLKKVKYFRSFFLVLPETTKILIGHVMLPPCQQTRSSGQRKKRHC